MKDVYIVDAVRSPIGKYFGSLRQFSAPQIGAKVVKALIERNKIDPEEIEEMRVGAIYSGGKGQDLAKQVVVLADLPREIPTTRVDKVCASGLQAIADGFLQIAVGHADLVIAGGMESMSNVDYVARGIRGFVYGKRENGKEDIQKMGNIKLVDFIAKAQRGAKSLEGIELIDDMIYSGIWDCYSNLHMGTLAEKIGEKYNISRQEQDEFAFHSHRKAWEATMKGRFEKEIVPIEISDGRVFKVDEGIRPDTSIEALSKLKPVFKEGGTITAGNASQLSDGASFVLLMSEEKMKEYALKPLVKIEGFASSGIDPSWYGLAPVTCVQKLLNKTGYSLDEIDLIEINEAFAVQVLGVVRELEIDMSKLNVNGGAIALGHPIGASGARILTTLIYALCDRNKDLGLATMCHGGGGALALLVKKV